MAYKPAKLPSVSTEDGQALAAYFENELQVLAAQLIAPNSNLQQMNPLFVAPPKPRTGMIVYADGVSWDPGSGEGLYAYSSGGQWIWLEDNPVIPVIPVIPAKFPVFSVTLAANQTGIANNTFTKVAWDTVDFDSDSWWDATNKRYNPKRAGHFSFCTNVNNFSSTGAISLLAVSIYKNGTEYVRLSQSGAAAISAGGGGVVIHMNGTTDFVEVFVDIGAVTTRVISFSQGVRFSGGMLRAD